MCTKEKDQNDPWQSKPKTKCHTCYYNKMVDCDDSKDCVACGWNPFVSLYRITTMYGEKAGDYLTASGG